MDQLLHQVAPADSTRTGFEPLTEAECTEFAEQGFLRLRGVLSDEHRQRLTAAVDDVYAQEAADGNVRADGSLHLLGFVTRHSLFTELLTHATTFRYVWGLLGWNIYTHHNHLDVTPPAPEPDRAVWGWHQDGYRQNSDAESLYLPQPRPMFSLKIGYVLSDLSITGRGATKIIRGSHLWNSLSRPEPTAHGYQPDPDGSEEIVAEPGDAFLFDRRLWHSRSPNHSTLTRKMLFVGYTYRWIRPLDEIPVDRSGQWWQQLSPLHRQLLGDGEHHAHYWGIGTDGYVAEDVPLRRELRERGLLDRTIPWLR